MSLILDTLLPYLTSRFTRVDRITFFFNLIHFVEFDLEIFEKFKQFFCFYYTSIISETGYREQLELESQ